MRILLDTHVLLWALVEPERLDQDSRAAIRSGVNAVLFSSASIWEIAIKAGLRRADFVVDPVEVVREAVAAGLTELALRSSAAVLVAELPPLHRDPFDRVLIAQAIAEPAFLYTADQRLSAYSELVRQVGAR
ncbi:MAG: type II toxin-antitoxin system VapC family toxin [Stellaceae bacterium]